MLPVVAGAAGVAQAFVASHDSVIGDNDNAARIQPRADHLAGQLAGHRVAVARHRHQAGAGHPCGLLHVAVEGLGHGHQVGPLVLEHLCHAELAVLGMTDLAPQRPAALAQPRIELGEGAEAAPARLDPDAPTTVLHVLLHAPLLPAGGHVAEVRVIQAVRAHHREARH